MIDLFETMRIWTNQIGDAGVAAKFILGEEDRPKRAAWVDLEGPSRAGELIVWESGEAEYASYERGTLAPVTVESTMATTPAEVEALLQRLLAGALRQADRAMRFRTGHDRWRAA